MSDDTDYELLDSGEGRKLERVGPILLERQAVSAWWRQRLPPERWRQAAGVHVRDRSGGGHWEFPKRVPEAWTVRFSGLALEIRATPFGHIGLFPEHAPQWRWMAERVAARVAARALGAAPVRVLNLFAYTGAASIACAAAGARVTHVDAAPGVVKWAARNALANEIEPARIQWITEDAAAFVARERRRGNRYHGILLDPPTFGRADRKVWNIETDLPALLTDLAELVDDDLLFVVLTCHTPGFTPLVLSNLLADALPRLTSEGSELSIPESTGRLHPAGCYARIVGD
jgi:23S rRNA (cytosine1962-C5)-methyltransferase